jgi:hypothetical protein
MYVPAYKIFPGRCRNRNPNSSDFEKVKKYAEKFMFRFRPASKSDVTFLFFSLESLDLCEAQPGLVF